MLKGYICVLDSGIGGLSVLNELQKLLPYERYIYVSDKKNSPYGEKSERKLFSLAMNMINDISRYPLKVIVLGCNTLSMTIRWQLENATGIPTFGVFPPVETEQLKNNKTLLLATPVTAGKFNSNVNITIFGIKNLASDIENNIFNIESIKIERHLAELNKRRNFFDTVILGCTHYYFVKNKILDHFCPKNITSGNHFTAKNVFDFLLREKSLENNLRNEVLFLGKNSEFNKKVYFEVVKNGF